MAEGELTVEAASAELYEALTRHYGPRDFAADDPLVVAIAEYGERCREGDEAAIDAAGDRVYQELTHHYGPLDLSGRDPFVKALAAFGEACRREGKASQA